jgi:hypothetical protein
VSLWLGVKSASSSNSKYHNIETPCGEIVPFNVAVSLLGDVPVLTADGGSVVTLGDSLCSDDEITVVFSQSVVA